MEKAEPLAYAALTKEQFDFEIDVREGKVYSADEVEAEMRSEFGL